MIGGYLCYQWAWLFQQAMVLENSKCFVSRFDGVTKLVGRAQPQAVHAWPEIWFLGCQSDHVFVDDSYADGDWVHPTRPVPIATNWTYHEPLTQSEIDEWLLLANNGDSLLFWPIPYDSNNNPYGDLF